MARYKHYDYNQTKMIPLRFADQFQPGTFEYTLNHVVDTDLDLSVFESRYRNDVNGAPAYDPVAQRFIPADFDYDPLTETCRCPAGQPMWKRFKGLIGKQETISIQGYHQHCRDCSLKHQCLRRPNQKDGR